MNPMPNPPVKNRAVGMRKVEPSKPGLPPVKAKEVRFQPDERAILDWLHRHVKSDATIAASDTRLLNELRWKEDAERFFRAKSRLIAAGAIAMHIDILGQQILTLLQPERKESASKRYAFQAVPLELLPEIRRQVRAYRIKKRLEEEKVASPPPLLNPEKMRLDKPAVPKIPVPPSKRRVDFQKAAEQAMGRLGVAPVETVPG